MLAGSAVYAFMVLFVHQKEAVIFGVAKALTGKPYLAFFPWNIIDPLVVALPASAAALVLVSLASQSLPREHLRACFRNIHGPGAPALNE